MTELEQIAKAIQEVAAALRAIVHELKNMNPPEAE